MQRRKYYRTLAGGVSHEIYRGILGKERGCSRMLCGTGVRSGRNGKRHEGDCSVPDHLQPRRRIGRRNADV